jgi:hypothetical protein
VERAGAGLLGWVLSHSPWQELQKNFVLPMRLASNVLAVCIEVAKHRAQLKGDGLGWRLDSRFARTDSFSTRIAATTIPATISAVRSIAV